jgi:hypothetical protein
VSQQLQQIIEAAYSSPEQYARTVPMHAYIVSSISNTVSFSSPCQYRRYLYLFEVISLVLHFISNLLIPVQKKL